MQRFENWEFPYALVLGTGAAAQYALKVQVEIAGEQAASLPEIVIDKHSRLTPRYDLLHQNEAVVLF